MLYPVLKIIVLASLVLGLPVVIHDSFVGGSQYFVSKTTPTGVLFGDGGLTLTLAHRLDNPSVESNFELLHGKIEAEIFAASGNGIISSFYLQSDDFDEIDVAEIFGGNPYLFQSNFFVKGNVTTYDRGEYHQMNIPPMDQYHKYGIEWTEEKIDWLLNGQVVRTLKSDSHHKFPTSPAKIRFSLWAGGDALNTKGTIMWAGGLTDYSEMPFRMHVKSVAITPYTGSTKSKRGEFVLVDSLSKGNSSKTIMSKNITDSFVQFKSGNVTVESSGSRCMIQSELLFLVALILFIWVI